MKLAETLSACVDCFLIVSGTPDDNCPQECFDAVDRVDTGHLAVDRMTDEFSRIPCDICRRQLAGARFDVHRLEPETEPTA